MTHDAGTPSLWRHTARTARFFMFDASAGIPFLFFLAHIAWWTFSLATVSFTVFGTLERFGYSPKIAARLLRVWLAGRIRYALPLSKRPR